MLELQGLGTRNQGLEMLPCLRAANSRDVSRGGQIRHYHHVLDLRDARRDVAYALEAIDFFSAVAVRIGAEEDTRTDLAEPVEYAVDAEVRRARRPDGADARR